MRISLFVCMAAVFAAGVVCAATSASYVQRGLIAKWDGIDNVGTGVHDPNATVWKDLKGNLDMTLTSKGRWMPRGNALFVSGLGAGADMVMVSHISAPEVTDTNEPASLSYILMTEKLREELGFEGAIITDSFEMKAISGIYDPGEAAVAAILAGADIVLMPADYEKAFDAVLAAVESGEISAERLEESLRRILRLKADLAGM